MHVYPAVKASGILRISNSDNCTAGKVGGSNTPEVATLRLAPAMPALMDFGDDSKYLMKIFE